MGQQMSSLLGSSGSIVEGGRPSPEFVGPMPGARQGASGVAGGLSKGLDKIKGFASFLGDSQDERENNAKKFAALVKDIGNMGKDMADSTLMQRLMKESMSGPAYMSEGQAPSGGIAAIPPTFDPATAGRIMSQLGFK
jgi:hypothetical protein